MLASARGAWGRGGLPGGGGTLPASFHSATSPDGEAFLAGFARAKGAPSGELAEPARPEGLLPPCRFSPTHKKSAALFPKSGTSLFKSVQNKKPKITRDAAPQTAIITTAARMGGSHCRARPG